ncbi:MAG: hypothetical protein K2Y40_18075 [Reyranella sp.]|nr:hypothetical protein [Reyranella sp.]
MIRRCRKVVDSNYLGREELRHWLAASSQHYAVITAAALTEVVKGNALRAIVSSMAILSEFPRQVIILKNDAEVARLTESVANPQLRLIDKTQTAEFPGFCKKLALMKPLAVHEFLTQGKIVNEGFAQAETDVQGFSGQISKAMEHYSAAEGRKLNAGGRLPRSLIREVFDGVYALTQFKLEYLKIGRMPTGIALLDAFAFREALCTYTRLVRFEPSAGGASPAPSSRCAHAQSDVDHRGVRHCLAARLASAAPCPRHGLLCRHARRRLHRCHLV